MKKVENLPQTAFWGTSFLRKWRVNISTSMHQNTYKGVSKNQKCSGDVIYPGGIYQKGCKQKKKASTLKILAWTPIQSIDRKTQRKYHITALDTHIEGLTTPMVTMVISP